MSERESVGVGAAHLAVVEGEAIGDLEFETDRARFLGRGNDVGNAVAAIDGRPLSNTVGRVLDPVFALRRRLRIPAGGTARRSMPCGTDGATGRPGPSGAAGTR